MEGFCLSHRRGSGSFKSSPLFWFVLFFIPFANIYYLWKVVQNISGHEKVGEDYSYLDLREETVEAERKSEPVHIVHKEKASAVRWFILSLTFTYLALLFMVVNILFVLVSVAATLYLAWRMADLIAGHRKEQNWKLTHREKKESTTRNFIMGLVPFAIILLWRSAKIIAKHKSISKE